jgi:hypothetical protein
LTRPGHGSTYRLPAGPPRLRASLLRARLLLGPRRSRSFAQCASEARPSAVVPRICRQGRLFRWLDLLLRPTDALANPNRWANRISRGGCFPTTYHRLAKRRSNRGPGVENGANDASTSRHWNCGLCGRHSLDTPRNDGHSRFGNERPDHMGDPWRSDGRGGLGMFCVGRTASPKGDDRVKLKAGFSVVAAGHGRSFENIPRRAACATAASWEWTSSLS